MNPARRRAPNAVAIGIGLLVGLLCVGAGQLAMGIGDGWRLPRDYGVLALILYPLALLRRRWTDGATSWRRDLSLTALVAAPILLLLALAGVPAHPWTIPLAGWLAIVGAVAIYALVGWRLERRRLHAAWGAGVLVVIGLALDIAAVADLMSPPPVAADMLALPWLLLWLGWQAIAFTALARHLRARAAIRTATEKEGAS